MPSVSFDGVAQQYDATRGYTAEVAQQLAETIDGVAHGSVGTRFLEVGVGTGRFALPLAERGRQYTGVDISEKMLGQLEEKLEATAWRKDAIAWGGMPDEDAARNQDVRRFTYKEKQAALRLIVSDITSLPLLDNSFDAALAVHVFHIVADWQKALEETLRVLRPGGVLVRCWEESWDDAWQPGPGDIRKQWSKIVHELGGSAAHPGANEQRVTDWLQQRNLETEQAGSVIWQRELTPHAIFASVEQRLWTSTLVVPDDLFATSIQLLRQWVNQQYGDSIDDPYIQTQHIVVNTTRIPA